MKNKIATHLIILFIVVFIQENPVCAQVSGIPFSVGLDSFTVISGTQLDGPGADDVQFPNLNIGFSFNYGGIIHNTFTATTNGYIELDTITQVMLFNPLKGPRNNIIAPFGADLMHVNGNASLQYSTIGIAPNRVTIIQWLHYSYFGGNGDLNFQIHLYETSNCISFVYGSNSFLTNPFQTQIGLRGDTIADFIALGDTSCNWASAYPYPSVNTNFPVSLSCNMPPGFAFNFGACNHNGSLNYGYITGKVFNDVNGNGFADNGEPGINQNILNINPGNYYVSSDAGGNYAFFFFDSTLTYSINSSSILYWNQTTPATLNVLPLSQSCSGNNFGQQMIPGIQEISITTSNWGAQPGQPEQMPISYFNNGTTTVSDTIVFEMDSLYSFVSATPVPLSVSGQTITWTYSNLLPGNSGYITLNLLPSANAVLGNYLNSTLTINPIQNDTVPGNNVVQLHQLISNSWDPNEKSVDPQGMIAAGTTLNYVIHFQNTGNAPASNVVIRDTLDAGLDPMTFKITGYSHPLNFTMDGNGIANFSFYNIQLPDSGTDFAGSNGFVSYSVKTYTNLIPLTTINNVAGIYFDFNEAIMTNVVSDTIQFISTGETDNTDNLPPVKATPNPSADYVVFSYSKDLLENAKLTILTMEGKLALVKEKITSTESVNIKSLPPGIYLCTVNTGNKIMYLKFIRN